MHGFGAEPHGSARADRGAEGSEQLAFEEALVRIYTRRRKRAGEPCGDLGGGRYRGDDVLAAEPAAVLRRRQRRRYRAHPEVTAAAAERVEVEGMGGGAVGEGGGQARGPKTGAEHRGLRRVADSSRHPQRAGAAAAEGGTRERGADGIEGEALDRFDHRLGQVLVAQARGKGRDPYSQSHARCVHRGFVRRTCCRQECYDLCAPRAPRCRTEHRRCLTLLSSSPQPWPPRCPRILLLYLDIAKSALYIPVRNYIFGKDMRATITSKRQVTVPKPVRDQLKLSPGDKLEFLVDDDGTVRVIPVTATKP